MAESSERIYGKLMQVYGKLVFGQEVENLVLPKEDKSLNHFQVESGSITHLGLIPKVILLKLF